MTDTKNLSTELRDSANYLSHLAAIDFSREVVLNRQAADEIEQLRAEIADAHAFAYNALPGSERTGDTKDTLDEQIHVLSLCVKNQQKEIERLQAENEADSSWPIVERFLKAAGIVPLSPSETTPEQIERGITEVERLRSIVNKRCKCERCTGISAESYYTEAAEAARKES